jgi:hypothetical protein
MIQLLFETGTTENGPFPSRLEWDCCIYSAIGALYARFESYPADARCLASLAAFRVMIESLVTEELLFGSREHECLAALGTL